jgi:hypothetical protein
MSLSGRIFWTRDEVDKTLGIRGTSNEGLATDPGDKEEIEFACR